MKYNYYCPICQAVRDGSVKSVVRNAANDIVVVNCGTCWYKSTLYLTPNTIPAEITLKSPWKA